MCGGSLVHRKDKWEQDKYTWPKLLWAIDVPHMPGQSDAKMRIAS